MSCPNIADGVEAPVHLKRSSCYREKERKEGETRREEVKMNKAQRDEERERILKETEDERRRDERGDNN